MEEHNQSKIESCKQARKNKTVETKLRKSTRKPTEVTHEPITTIISKQLEIKLGPFTQEELDSVIKKELKTGKLQGWTRFPQKYGRPDNSMTYCSNTVTQSIIKIR